MNPDTSNIEERLDHLVNLYENLDEWLDKIPGLPVEVRNRIKKGLVENQEMTRLVDGIKNRRPPRFVLVGRTGVGKSSLINAMCGRYLAKTSDVVVGTNLAKEYSYKSLGKTLFEIIDTRGLAESRETGQKLSSEDQLHQTIRDFQPDAILFLQRQSTPQRGREVPQRLENIAKAKEEFEKILDDQNVTRRTACLCVHRMESADYSGARLGKTSIEFDGRYNINGLIDLLEDNIDIRASIALMLATRVDQICRRLSEKFTKIFAAAASLVAIPIPIADYPILLGLQVILAMIIAYLAGRDMSYDTAAKFIVAIGALGAAGFAFRGLAQQASKFLNLIVPGAGSVVSASIAGAATWGIGKAAISYFFDSSSAEEARNIGRRAQREIA